MANRNPQETAPDERPGLGSYSNLPGDPLEVIEGERVMVVQIEITQRRLRDNPNANFALLTLDTGQIVHTWSQFLIEKLEQVPANALPAPATFRQIETANRRKVWTVE